MPSTKDEALSRALRKIPSLEFSHRKAKNAIFSLLHFSNSYLFEKCVAYPCTTGHFELIEVPSIRTTPEIKALLRMAAEQEHRSIASMMEVRVLD